MPPLIALAFITLNPEMGLLLIETAAGRIALAIGIVFELIGVYFVRKFAQVEV